MPSKTQLTTAEAKRKWGEDIYVRLTGGRRTFREFAGEGGVWRPTFDPGLVWTGYQLTKVDYDIKRSGRYPR